MEKPTVFKPTIEDQERIAKMIASSFSKNKGIRISNNKLIQGTKSK